METLIFVFIGIIGILLYFLPFIISLKKNSAEAGAIFFINLLVGFTFIGWIVCFLWAISNSEVSKTKSLQLKKQLGIIDGTKHSDKEEK